MLLAASVRAPVHTTCSSRQSQGCSEEVDKQLVLRGFQKATLYLLENKLWVLKHTGVCVVFCVAAKYSSIFA